MGAWRYQPPGARPFAQVWPPASQLKSLKNFLTRTGITRRKFARRLVIGLYQDCCFLRSRHRNLSAKHKERHASDAQLAGDGVLFFPSSQGELDSVPVGWVERKRNPSGDARIYWRNCGVQPMMGFACALPILPIGALLSANLHAALPAWHAVRQVGFGSP